MASPYANGPVIYLIAADSPFNKLIESARIQTLILTPAAADATLTLYANTVTTDDTKNIGQIIARSGQASVTVTFSQMKETPFTVVTGKWLSAKLTGTGAVAFIYMS